MACLQSVILNSDLSRPDRSFGRRKHFHIGDRHHEHDDAVAEEPHGLGFITAAHPSPQ
jgi:hypothetical protein